MTHVEGGTALASLKKRFQVRGVLGSIFACEANGTGSTPVHLTNLNALMVKLEIISVFETEVLGSSPSRCTNL